MASTEHALVVRTATDQDLQTIVAQYVSAGGVAPWLPFASVDRIRRLRRKGLLVAELDGKYAGFLFWYDGRRPGYDNGVDRFARISDLYLHPSAQGKGIGRAFLKEALTRIRGAGIDTVFLETDENNVRARTLYESEGFVAFAKVLRYKLKMKEGGSRIGSPWPFKLRPVRTQRK